MPFGIDNRTPGKSVGILTAASFASLTNESKIADWVSVNASVGKYAEVFEQTSSTPKSDSYSAKSSRMMKPSP